MEDSPRVQHTRPEGTEDRAVAATGKMSEALETLERARGHLYSFHQLIGQTDLTLDEALELLRACGSTALADEIERDLVGRNVLAGRWTFQVIEEFDDEYWTVFRSHERAVREALVDGRRHVYEAEMKERRRTHGHPAHTARPAS
jgi:hypothetical protein